MSHRTWLPPILFGLLLTGCGYRAPLHQSYIPEVTDSTRYATIRPEYRTLAALMEKDTGLRPVDGNTVTLIADGREKLEMLKEEMRKARISIYIEPYRFRLDSTGVVLAGILKDKAREGVDARVIADKSANKKEDRTELKKLRKDGVRMNFFHRPAFWLDRKFPSLATHRDHRKLTLLDGRIAYVGSRNIQSKYFFDWHDIDIRVTGPVVADFSEAFRRNQALVDRLAGDPYVAPDAETTARTDTMPGKPQYRGVTMQVVPETPADRKLPIRNCLEWVIGQSRRYFWFYNPYTPPPQSIIQALKDAALRGVDVRWIVPGINDVGPEKGMSESLYQELLDAGVRIYEWQEHTMHAKQYLCDDYLTVIGSANLDNLSLFLNYEMVAVVYDERICRKNAETFLSDLAVHCREISRNEVRRWPLSRRIRNWFIRVLGGSVG